MSQTSSAFRRAVYPGSFDPITSGHVDLIKRASVQFDELIVLVSDSNEKKHLFTSAERKALIELSLGSITNVTVDIHQGLTVDYVHRVGAGLIVRGLRAVTDFEYEMSMASMNRKLNPKIDTVLLFASPEAYFISSRAVKEVAKFGGNLAQLVPEHVIAPLKQKMK